MKLQEAQDYLQNLINNSSKKSEIKVLEKFIQIINGLQEKPLTANEIQSIETELGELKLKSDVKNRKKHLHMALNKFEKFIQKTFFFTIGNYYTNRGIAFGSSFGLLFGIIFLNSFERSMGIALGLSLGMIIGLIIGRSLDTKAKASGNMV